MTKGLAITLFISVIFMVSQFVETGGTLDTYVNETQSGAEHDSAEDEASDAASGSSASQRSASFEPDATASQFADEVDDSGFAPTTPTANPTRSSSSSRSSRSSRPSRAARRSQGRSGDSERGALTLDRQNIES